MSDKTPIGDLGPGTPASRAALEAVQRNGAGELSSADEAEVARRLGEMVGEMEALGRGINRAATAGALPESIRQPLIELNNSVLFHLLVDNARNGLGAPAAPLPGAWGAVQRPWHRVNRRIAGWMRRFQRPNLGWFSRWWTVIGTAMSTVAATLVVVDAYVHEDAAAHQASLLLAAAVLLVVRMIGSALVGPSEGRWVADDAPFGQVSSMRERFIGCVASHANDILLAAAAALWLYHHHIFAWAIAVGASTGLAMFVTLTRVAAERNGFQVPRFPLERFARNGSILVGLVGTALLPVYTQIPSFAAIAFGFAGYALLDTLRIALSVGYAHPSAVLEMSIGEDNVVRFDGATVVDEDAFDESEAGEAMAA